MITLQRKSYEKASGRLLNRVLLVLSSKNGKIRKPCKPSASRAGRLLILRKDSLCDVFESLVFKLEPGKPFRIGRSILLRAENFACKLYWFQTSAVVCQKQKVPRGYALKLETWLRLCKPFHL